MLPVLKKMFKFDAMPGNASPHAGRQLIECRSIYDVADVSGGRTGRQEMMKMELFEAAVESKGS